MFTPGTARLGPVYGVSSAPAPGAGLGFLLVDWLAGLGCLYFLAALAAGFSSGGNTASSPPRTLPV
jgi:hypothetical protein